MPAGVGLTLRAARIRAGVQLSDVQAQTGIEAKYLRALEWERFDLLPDFDYARRAAHAEARALKLDPDATVAELERTMAILPRHGPSRRVRELESQATVTAPVREAAPAHTVTAPPGTDTTLDEPPLPAPGAERPADPHETRIQRSWSDKATISSETSRMPSQARRLLVGALLGGLAAFLVVDLLVFRDESSSSTPTAASQPEPSAAPTLVPPTPAFGGPVGTTVVEPPSGPGLGAAAGAEDGTQGEPAASGGEAESTGAEPATAGSADGAAAPPPVQEVEISTPRGESWLQVRRGRQAGPILYEGVLAPDKTVTFEAKTLFIRVGAVASVDIHQDGSLVSDGLVGTLDLELTRARGLRVVS